MTMHINPSHIIFDEFGGLEKPQEAWRGQFAYWEDYAGKFFKSNGMTFDIKDSNVEAWLMADDRAPFASMVDALLPRLAERCTLDQVEAILFAHWLPDLHLGTSVTNFAMHRLALTDCFGFAISDRGLSAPFFAFDTLHKYLGRVKRRGLLIIADQKHVMYKSDLVASLDPKNSACVIMLDTGNRDGLRYTGYVRKPNAEDDAELAIASILAALNLDPHRTKLIGPEELIAFGAPGLDHVATDERLICSAPFAALSQTEDQTFNHLLLCRDGDAISALGFAGAGS
jgi:hypothetical protein